MSYPNDFCTQISGILRNGGGSGQRRAGYFERNLRRRPQGAVRGNQSPSTANIQGSGEFDEFFVVLVVAAHKYGYGQRKSYPGTAFRLRLATIQRAMPL